MKLNRLLCALLVGCCLCLGLASCSNEKTPDFSGYQKIAKLATLKCTFHNVAEINNPGNNILFGINVGYKKVWFEYDGKVNLGVNVKKVKIEGPDVFGKVTIKLPEAQVIGEPDADPSTFSNIYHETGLLTKIETVDQKEALALAQDEMKNAAESNEQLMRQARDRAGELLTQYVLNVGESIGKRYEVAIEYAE